MARAVILSKKVVEELLRYHPVDMPAVRVGLPVLLLEEVAQEGRQGAIVVACPKAGLLLVFEWLVSLA